ncbi:central glycolytic genes regulator [Salinibacillus kushneri]|uniref:Central glycolytic genes regulator n=1 Tax=Salinibacillus kushneri TaxID=237682 RepID=A0A1H9YKS5_9BACI|nr:sugar-binding domain-containing protein [Salinibacillus kushneri]SES69602.1 central glycolytic genes regulator [Salinibacillus kushneri]
MKDLISLQQKVFPEVMEFMERRTNLLKSIQLLQPIGRRSLAEQAKLAERLVRGEVEFFQQQGFVEITSKGIHMTTEGSKVTEQLEQLMQEISGLKVLENQVKEKFQLEKVIVVPGNSDDERRVKQELGKACVSYLKGVLEDNMTIAVTGGSTMSLVAESMTPLNKKNCLFVPSRGGLGEQLENQANTICAQMANKAQGEYRLLYVPDPISEKAYQSIIEEPAVKEISNEIQHADIVLHGIGEALTMAERRKTPEDQLKRIKEDHGVGEAFGYYFDKSGKIVHKVRTVGLQMEDLQKIKQVIAVAGGTSKADAIESYFKQGRSNVLITDEAAAEKLVKG